MVKKFQYIKIVSKTRRCLERQKNDKNPFENTYNKIKSAFKRHTSNISMNYAVGKFDLIYLEVIIDPPLVLNEFSRQAANLFAHDRLRLIRLIDSSDFFDILHDAGHFMRKIENPLTHNDIESALCSCGTDKAPGRFHLTVRHFCNSGVTNCLHKIINTVLRRGTTPTN
jgi:hypothetical protein